MSLKNIIVCHLWERTHDFSVLRLQEGAGRASGRANKRIGSCWIFLGGSLDGNHVGGAWCPASLKKIIMCHHSESKHMIFLFCLCAVMRWSCWDGWWVRSCQRHNTEKSLPSFPLVSVGKIPRKYRPIPNQNTELRCNSIKLWVMHFLLFAAWTARQ